MKDLAQKLETTAKVLGLGVAITYSTGFIVVFAFLATFGVTDMSGELFRVKYVYVGILCLVFPATLCIPLLIVIRDLIPEGSGLTLGKWRQHVRSAVEKATVPHMVLLVTFNLVVVTYILVGLAQPGEIRARQGRIILLFMGLLLLWLNKKLSSPRYIQIGRFVVFVISLLWDIYTLWGVDLRLGRGALYYVLVMTLASWRCLKSLNVRANSTVNEKTYIQLFRVLPTIVFVVFGILLYSLNIYSRIPADLGGGDYSDTASVRMEIGHRGTGSMPQEVMETPTCTHDLTIIDETGDAYYVALSDDRGTSRLGITPDPQDGRPAPLIWREGNFFPTIYTISRKNIVSIASYRRVNGQAVAQHPCPV